jgi:hypothetical protein
MNEYKYHKLPISKMKHTLKRGKKVKYSSKTMKRPRNGNISIPTTVFDHVPKPYYKELTGISNKIMALMKKINDIDNNDPRKDVLNHLIGTLNKGNLSMFQTKCIIDGNNYPINSDSYWEHIIKIADEMKKDFNVERGNKIGDIKQLMYKPDSSSWLIKKIDLLNDSHKREKHTDGLKFSSGLEQCANEKECLINVLEMNKHLDDMLLIYTDLEGMVFDEQLSYDTKFFNLLKDMYKICDTSKENVLDVTELLYKFDSLSIHTIQKKTKVALDTIRDDLISVHRILNKIDTL